MAEDQPDWQRGGGAVWLVGAADPDLGLVYYVTGNGVPQLAVKDGPAPTSISARSSRST